MKTRIIWTKIHFEDDWFNSLPLNFKYLYIYLFTNSHIGLTGVYSLPKRVALLETGSTDEEWVSACRIFEDSGKVKFSGDWVYVVNAIRYTNYSGPKNEEANRKELLSIPKDILDTLSIPYIYPIDTTINHKSKIINQKQEIINKKNYKLIGNTYKEI